MLTKDQNQAARAISLEEKHGAHNYHPLPVVLSKGEGVYVWDVDGKKYYDFLSAYSAVNQGHCHPRIVNAMIKQAQTLTLTSRAFHNDKLGPYEAYVTNYFGFDKVLPMNTGAEAVETSVKISRKWAYEVKGIPEGQAQIIVCENNFHGRTTTIISFSNDPVARKNFGPFTKGFIKIEYDNLEALEATLKNNPNVAGFLVEPIQGEAGVYVPQEGYLAKAKALCEKYGILFVADEVMSGFGRTGKWFGFQNHEIVPDMVCMAKGLTASYLPLGCLMVSDKIAAKFETTPMMIGLTYNGHPVALAAALAVINIYESDKLIENTRQMGAYLESKIEEMRSQHPSMGAFRNTGLLGCLDVLKNKTTGKILFL